MAYVAPSTRSAGALITAQIWNQDVVANAIAVHAGELAIADQIVGRFIVASSATQLSARMNAFVKVFQEVYT